jgi:hypothetical protein
MITDLGVLGILRAALAIQPGSDSLASLCPTLPSQVIAGGSQDLSFLGTPPAMRKWIETRLAKKIKQWKHAVSLDKFESTVDVGRELLENDQTMQVRDAIAELAARLNAWKAARIAALINANSNAFDGVAFFADTHAWGDSGTIDNNTTSAAATGTTPTANEAASALATIADTILGYKDDSGEPVNEDITEFAVICGATQAAPHRQAIGNTQLDTGAGTRDNPLKGYGQKFRLISTPRITATDAIYVVVSGRSTGTPRPFLFVENALERRTTKKGEGSDYAHDTDRHQYGVQAVGEAATGRFWEAVKHTYT